jgi:anti-sigma factor RsiW
MSMTCEQAQPLLSAYFDRELDAASSLEVALHAQACDGCAAILQQHQGLRAALAQPALVFSPPSGLEERVRNSVRREVRMRTPSASSRWRWAAVPLAAALAAALSWSVASYRAAPSGEDLVLAELVSGHVRSLMADHLVDVATSDRHTVKPWFNGKVDFAPPVADFAASGFQLVGGRVDYIARRPVAVLVYKWKQHTVNVFIWRSEGAARAELRSLTHEGYQLVSWEQSGLSFWAVSDLNLLDLGKLVHLFRTGA